MGYRVEGCGLSSFGDRSSHCRGLALETRVLVAKLEISIWVVVKIRVPFWVLNI